jgi:hypothetical protein
VVDRHAGMFRIIPRGTNLDVPAPVVQRPISAHFHPFAALRPK